MANKTAGGLVAVGVGTILLWSGIHGSSITASIQDLIRGQKPAGTDVNNLTSVSLTGETDNSSGSSAGGLSSTGNVLAAEAMQFNRYPYVWGAAGPNSFDCSGLVNYCCKQLGLPNPSSKNGSYSGHGPVTTQWFYWSGATTIAGSDAQAGDLACWITHMGIFVDSTHIISALDPALGVQVTTVAGATPGPEPFRVRRMKSLVAAGAGGSGIPVATSAKLGTL